jgi:hypothetical protein
MAASSCRSLERQNRERLAVIDKLDAWLKPDQSAPEMSATRHSNMASIVSPVM